MLMSRDELLALGFAFVGKDVRVTRHALFFNPANISIGDRTRIDAFAIVAAGAAGVAIGCNVHIAAHTLVNGSGGRVVFEDFSTIAPNVCVWTTSDDYTGGSLTNGTIPSEFKQNATGPVTIGRHVIIGTGSVVLPNVHLHEGASVGALSMVTRDVPVGHVVCGCPAKMIKLRSIDNLHRAEQAYLATLSPKT
jgi:acetyltransferase-like isoleucine patch superfamily enzyme